MTWRATEKIRAEGRGRGAPRGRDLSGLIQLERILPLLPRSAPRVPRPGHLLAALLGRDAVVVGHGRVLVGRRGEGQVEVAGDGEG